LGIFSTVVVDIPPPQPQPHPVPTDNDFFRDARPYRYGSSFFFESGNPPEWLLLQGRTMAVLMGARPARIIGRHLLPSFMSHLIASATLVIPSMILGETALSFLGLGLRPPMTSWGVLLNEAQNINIVALYPWLMLPVINVAITVLAFNFFGDGLRDAADPYH